MEKDSKGHEKLFHRNLKTLKKEKAQGTNHIKSQDEVILQDDTEIMNKW